MDLGIGRYDSAESIVDLLPLLLGQPILAACAAYLEGQLVDQVIEILGGLSDARFQ